MKNQKYTNKDVKNIQENLNRHSRELFRRVKGLIGYSDLDESQKRQLQKYVDVIEPLIHQLDEAKAWVD